jgi:hypothetical protein
MWAWFLVLLLLGVEVDHSFDLSNHTFLDISVSISLL